MTDKDIHDSLVKWLRNATSLLFIKDRQSGDLPEMPYGVSTLTGVDTVRDRPQEILYNRLPNQSSAIPVIETEWQFSLHVIGADATTYLRKLRAHFELIQANEPLVPGLIIHEFSQIRNLPDYVNEAWEERAQIDLFLRGLAKDGVLVDTIEEINIITNRMQD